MGLFDSILGAASGGARVTARELMDMLSTGEPVTLVDVRTSGERKTERITGSVHVPLDEITRAGAPELNGRVVVYCASGIRSLRARGMLASLGCEGACDLKGGIKAWIAAGGEVERG